MDLKPYVLGVWKIIYTFDFKIITMKDNYEKIINQKYEALIKRSFKTKLELFLFNFFCKNEKDSGKISTEDFLSFKINDQLMNLYQKAWQFKDGKVEKDHKLTVAEIDEKIIRWNSENEELKKFMLSVYYIYFKSSAFPLKDFKSVYPEEEEKRECSYCGINEKVVKRLKNEFKIFTKSFRGGVIEIDRRNSNKEYSIDNIVLCCYWCNNAKSDEFTPDEFKEFIGPGMKKIWENRGILNR